MAIQSFLTGRRLKFRKAARTRFTAAGDKRPNLANADRERFQK